MHNSIYHDRLAEHFCTLSISGAPSFANPPQKGDVFSIIKKNMCLGLFYSKSSGVCQSLVYSHLSHPWGPALLLIFEHLPKRILIFAVPNPYQPEDVMKGMWSKAVEGVFDKGWNYPPGFQWPPGWFEPWKSRESQRKPSCVTDSGWGVGCVRVYKDVRVGGNHQQFQIQVRKLTQFKSQNTRNENVCLWWNLSRSREVSF